MLAVGMFVFRGIWVAFLYPNGKFIFYLIPIMKVVRV